MSRVSTSASQGNTVQSLVNDIKRGRLTRREALLRGGALGLSMPAMFALSSAGSSGFRSAAAQEASPEPTTGGTLRVGLQADPAELDPHLTSLTAA